MHLHHHHFLAPARHQLARASISSRLAASRDELAASPWSGLQLAAQTALSKAARGLQSAMHGVQSAVRSIDSATFSVEQSPPYSGMQSIVSVVPKVGSKRGASFLQLDYRMATMLQSYFGDTTAKVWLCQSASMLIFCFAIFCLSCLIYGS